MCKCVNTVEMRLYCVAAYSEPEVGPVASGRVGVSEEEDEEAL